MNVITVVKTHAIKKEYTARDAEKDKKRKEIEKLKANIEWDD